MLALVVFGHVPTYDDACVENCCTPPHTHTTSQVFYLKGSGGLEVHLTDDRTPFDTIGGELLDVDAVFPELSQPSEHKQSIARFQKLTDKFLVLHPGQDLVLGDIRYAMIPSSIRPLWGIRVTPQTPHGPVEFLQMRNREPGEMQLFINMLFEL